MQCKLEGVIPILPAAFSSTGEIDETSFRKVAEAAIGDGVHGLALFGLAGEYAKLTDEERGRLAAALVDQAAKRVPVVISITHHSAEIARKQAAAAAGIGADALMVLPPFFLSPGVEAVEAHLAAVAGEVDLPIIVQYAPIQTGSPLTAERLAALRSRHPNLESVKVDLAPSGPMVSRVSAVGLKPLVGYMGLGLPQDFERGALGVVPTVSVAKAFAHLWNLLRTNFEDGRTFHQRLLPLLIFMMQSVEMLVAVEKVFLHRRGLLASDYCRQPRWALDRGQRRELDRLWAQYADWLSAGAANNPRDRPQ